PSNIENSLDACPEVAYSCVIGVKDERKGQRVRAYVVLNDGYKPTDKTRASIMDQIKVKVASYALPKEIVFRDSMPKTLVGKVAFRELEQEAEAEQQLGEHS
ncbi:MAG: acyl--CoA ligase, partial [Firmicutes bacterium]|nr:acyl--CoA ligase [Bacillota bacterium]